MTCSSHSARPICGHGSTNTCASVSKPACSTQPSRPSHGEPCMKSDCSRDTFDPRRHFSGVRMQQGRVQLDADWNEQHDIIAHRVRTEAADIVDLCGGPLHQAAFHIVSRLQDLSPDEQKLPGNNLPLASPPPAADFLISAGHYYVDGILCENERLTSYLQQPDLPGGTAIAASGLYIVYVDVWQRHLTALDDPSIREIALGG